MLLVCVTVCVALLLLLVIKQKFGQIRVLLFVELRIDSYFHVLLSLGIGFNSIGLFSCKVDSQRATTVNPIVPTQILRTVHYI